MQTIVEADFDLMRAAYEGGPFVERLSERANRHAPEVRTRLVDKQLTRQFAPYIGVVRERAFGGTADLRRADNEGIDDTRIVAGLRIWF